VATSSKGEILDLSRDTYQHPSVRAPVCEVSRPLPRESFDLGSSSTNGGGGGGAVDSVATTRNFERDLFYTRIESDRGGSEDLSIDEYLNRFKV